MAFALLLQFSPFLNSIPGSQSGHSSPPPCYGTCLHFSPSFFERGRVRYFLPSSTRAESRIRTLGAFFTSIFPQEQKHFTYRGLTPCGGGITRTATGVNRDRAPGRHHLKPTLGRTKRRLIDWLPFVSERLRFPPLGRRKTGRWPAREHAGASGLLRFRSSCPWRTRE